MTFFSLIFVFASTSAYAAKAKLPTNVTSCANKLTVIRDDTSKLKGWTFLPSLAINHHAPVGKVDVNSNGSLFLSASEAGIAVVWTIDGNLVAELPRHKEEVRFAKFSPDGQGVITCSIDGICNVSDLSGNLLKSYSVEGRIWVATLSEDGRHLGLATLEGPIFSFDLVTGKRQQFDWQRRYARILQFSPDGTKLMAAGNADDDPILVWNSKNGDLIYRYSHINTKNWPPSNLISDARFDSKGNLVTSFFDGSMQTHDMHSFKMRNIELYLDDQAGHFLEKVQFSRNGRYVLGGIYSEGVVILDTRTGTKIQVPDHGSKLQGNVAAIYASPDNDYFIVISMSGIFSIWDYKGNLIGNLKGMEDGYWPIHIAFTPDGRFVIAGLNDNYLKIWQLKDQKGWMTRSQ
jgi:WD40 repeat protein